MTETDARRPIPRVNYTEALEAAAIAVTNAKDSKGNPIALCPKPLDVHVVRESLAEVSKWTMDPTFYCQDEGEGAELVACTNLILLATLLSEHLKAGNTGV